MRRSSIMFLAAVAAAALTGAAPAIGAPDLQDAPIGRLDWSSCGDPATPALQCAMLAVPLDYAKPRGRTITIKVNRLPATAPKTQQQGPILLNPGGPGASGLWMPAFISSKLPADVASTYDWIGFDPRGTNGSEPHVVCDAHYFDAQRPDYQVSHGTEKAWLERAAKY